MQKTSKIFIVGKHRSGTTLLTNTIINNYDIWTPLSNSHHGQIESFFFSSYLKYFNNGQTLEDKYALYEIFYKTDFAKEFKKMDINKLINLNPYAFFCTVMDAETLRKNKYGWVEKTPSHTKLLNELFQNVPDAKFIAMKRNFIEQLNSIINGLIWKRNLLNIIKESISVAIYETYINKFKYKHPDHILIIDYHSLVLRKDATISKISKFLNLKTVDKKQNNIFLANSSYSNAYDRGLKNEMLTKIEYIVAFFNYKVFLFFFKIISDNLFTKISNLSNEKKLPKNIFYNSISK